MTDRRRSSRRLYTTLLLAIASSSVSALVSPLEALRAAAPGLLPRRNGGIQPFDASHGHILATRPVNATKTKEKHSPSRGNSSSLTSSSSNSTISTEGRYGHSAIYSKHTNMLYFVGGQLGENGTTVTNEVLAFNLGSSIFWGPRALSAIPDNPMPVETLSTGLDPVAWAASTVDAKNTAWIIGGVTEDCERDHNLHTFDLNAFNSSAMAFSNSTANWTTPRVNPNSPPRRRQAQAIAIHNVTTRVDDIYVFGGIAEEFTCSDETIGYVGIDRYSTLEDRRHENAVESFAWTAPRGTSAKNFEPPVSDYSATLMEDGRHVVIIGGQNARGQVAPLDHILIFDSRTRAWATKATKGKIPSPRMGHVALRLASGTIVMHGGISSDHVPVGDVHMLIPPRDLDSKSAWTWATLSRSKGSGRAPARAWHTATQLYSGNIVVAFGIDTSTALPSYDISFLKIDEKTDEYAFTSDFDGEKAWVAHHKTTKKPTSTARVHTAKTTTTKKKHKTKSVSSEAVVTEEQTATVAWASPSATYTQQAAVQPTTIQSTQTAQSTNLAVGSPSPLAASTKQSDSAAAAVAQKTRTIAASVGTLVGLVALVGVAALFLRRRNSQKSFEHTPGTPLDMTRGGGKDSAPVVSSLMYTRPVAGRHLSLGSTMSAVAGSDHNDDGEEDDYGYDGDDIVSSTGAVLGSTQDPFSDRHVVSELGQNRVVGNVGPGGFVEAASASSAETQKRTKSLLEALSPSVKSIRYLSGLQRSGSKSSYSDGDNYTVRSSSSRSRRGNAKVNDTSSMLPDFSSVAPSLPPGASFNQPPPLMQEYGLAVSKEQTPQAAFMEFRPRVGSHGHIDANAPPAGFAGVGSGSLDNHHPTILRPNTPGRISRPSTPLRVTNAD